MLAGARPSAGGGCPAGERGTRALGKVRGILLCSASHRQSPDPRAQPQPSAQRKTRAVPVRPLPTQREVEAVLLVLWCLGARGRGTH
ncbi:Uncharacterised protein [Chlamydia abortus]|nr:Uncharacterised protein [Chlamydia abortus]